MLFVSHRVDGCSSIVSSSHMRRSPLEKYQLFYVVRSMWNPKEIRIGHYMALGMSDPYCLHFARTNPSPTIDPLRILGRTTNMHLTTVKIVWNILNTWDDRRPPSSNPYRFDVCLASENTLVKYDARTCRAHIHFFFVRAKALIPCKVVPRAS